MALINTMTETNPKIQFIKALQKAQKEFPSLEKSKKVDQGAFKYDYLPLEQMLSLIQPVLHNNGYKEKMKLMSGVVLSLIKEDIASS
jgi:hypothetical protein